MVTIHLNKLSFFSHHGIHEEEAITGTNFELDIAVRFDEEGTIRKIDDTINYVSVYNMVSLRMRNPEPLLETLVMELANDLHLYDERIKYVSITIFKEHPPISNFCGRVGVTYEKEF